MLKPVKYQVWKQCTNTDTVSLLIAVGVVTGELREAGALASRSSLGMEGQEIGLCNVWGNLGGWDDARKT